MTPQELWERVRADLQTSVSQSAYTMWIAPTVAVEVKMVGDRPILILSSPTVFHRNTLEQRYYAQIQEAIRRVDGKHFEIQFQVGKQTQAQQKTDKPADGAGEHSQDAPLFTLSIQQQRERLPSPLERAFKRSGLREDYSFETFAVSSSNEMAHAAAIAVSQAPGAAYNPLFLYGGVGVGKTHLMQAIGNNILRKDADTPLHYTTGEQFTNDIVAAIQQKKTIQLKERLRSYRVLLIDDIQFIAGKTGVQEEFFHTFNAILPTGGQIVMTSDRPPHEINPLEDRLKSRFEAGLIIDIQEPTFELRTAILLIKAKKLGLDLPMEVAQLIASAVESTRKLEGVLAKIHSKHALLRIPITTELAKEIIGTIEQPAFPVHALKSGDVIRAICNQFHLNSALLKGPSREKQYVRPRHLAMYILKNDLGMPLMQIGSLFNGRDHTSVLHATRKIARDLEKDEELRTVLSAVKTSLSTYHS